MAKGNKSGRKSELHGPALLTGRKYDKFIPFLLISLSGVLCYYNSFDCSFHFDDRRTIYENSFIRSLNISTLWDYSRDRFFPYLSFALNYSIHGYELWGYHLVNLLIHLFNSILVFSITVLFFHSPALNINKSPLTANSRSVALFAALMFVAHPLATNSVTYIVQRMTSMAALFYLFSIWFYLKGRLSKGKAWPFLIGSLLSAICAFLSKQNSFTLPLAIILIEGICFQQAGISNIFRQPRFWLAFMLFITFMTIVAMLYGSNISALPPKWMNDYRELTPLSYLFTQFTVIPKYIQLLLFPISLNLDYDWPLYSSLFDWPVFTGFLFLLGLFIWAVFQWKKNPFAAFGVLFFFLALAVESSIVPIDDLIFEHRTYLPSFGIFLTISGYFFILTSTLGKKMQTGLVALVVLTLMGTTHARNKVWKTPETLWADAILKSPGKARTNISYCDALYKNNLFDVDSGSRDEVIKTIYKHATIAYKLWPLHNDPPVFLGTCHYMSGRYDSAYYYQTLLVERDGEKIEFRQNLVKTLNKLQRYEESIRQANLILSRDSLNYEALYGLALAHTNSGNLETGLSYFLTLIKIYPDKKPVIDYTIKILRALGRNEEADYYNRQYGAGF